MDCLEAKPKLPPCARGELAPAEKAELDRHLATCEGCRLELELTRAVLGSSSPDPPIGTEPGIEQERVPEPVPDGPGPPRVLTSQLPETPEDRLDLDSIHPSEAYDPGAIELPHADPALSFEDAPGSAAPPPFGDARPSPREESVSFADLAMGSPAMEGPKAPARPGAGSAAGGASAPGGSGSSWDFEPVDVPLKAAPPEESLTFAKEALDRKRGRGGSKGARLLLWIGGAVGGVGLLGASVWMALAFREPDGSRGRAPAPGAPSQAGGNPMASDPAGSSAAVPQPAPDGAGNDPAAAQGAAPAVLRAGPGGTAIAPPLAPPAPMPADPRTSDPTRSANVPTSPPVSEAQPSAGKGPEAAKAPDRTAVTFREDELMPAPPREPRILTVEPDAEPGTEPPDEPEPSNSPSGGAEPTRSVSTSPIFVPPSSGTQSAPGGTTSKQPEGEAPPTGPIGRLHLATVTAEKNRDLDTLRKLKESWKDLVRSRTGPERARSKREYADCLWAIQKITSRDADRKEALAAYREYVLHAPAGGADPRTVSRMRQLEDILSDSR